MKKVSLELGMVDLAAIEYALNLSLLTTQAALAALQVEIQGHIGSDSARAQETTRDE